MKKGKKVAIVSALVLCKRTSAIINWYLEQFLLRQGNLRLLSSNQWAN